MAKEHSKKNIVQDVLPPKRSIRDIELPSRSRRLKVVEEEKPAELEPEEIPVAEERPKKSSKRKLKEAPQYTYEYDEPKKPSKKGKYALAIILLLLAGFGVSALFRGAQIRITPKQSTAALDATFTATKNSAGGSLGFQVVTVIKDMEKTVAAGQEETQVDKKAEGRIVIYNNYSTQSQKLVATTRFQTPEGLIFRIPADVVVPGKHSSGDTTVPGSVEVTVQADKPGPDYNVGLKDFTIPGFKGDPRYTQMYARSKTEMTGGFSGMQKVVGGTTLTGTEGDLETLLKAGLAKDIASQIPENYMLYSDSLMFSFDPATQATDVSGNIVLHKKGTASGVIFDKGVLSRAILSKTSIDTAVNPVKITNLDTLDFSYASGTDIKTGTTIQFNLKGNVNAVAIFDENKLKADLLGLSKKDAAAIISKYPAINEAWIETQPFWSQSIPSDPAKVTLTNTLAQ